MVALIGSFVNQYFWPKYYELTSEEKLIREKIEREATLVLEGRIDEVLLLFEENAFIRDESYQKTWHGIDEIAERYWNLPPFTYIKHVAIDITVSSDKTYARVFSETVGSFEDNGIIVEITTRGEKWTFKKINDEWKIIGFTCNIP